MFLRARIFLVAAMLVVTISCDDLPRDQNGATKQIQARGTIRVGIIENPPWVIRSDGAPAGAEVDLVNEFSSRMGAQPVWQWGGEEQLLGALEKYELDIVIGGLSDTTPWTDRVGLTRGYFKEKFLIGVPPNTPEPRDLEGTEVAVGPNTRLTALVRQEKAIPVSMEVSGGNLPIAAADWQMEPMGMRSTDIKLQTDNHVMATPPGENQLIKRLEEFLAEKHDSLPDVLRRQTGVGK
jgi:polar amino acid transport system substrate-binding protein